MEHREINYRDRVSGEVDFVAEGKHSGKFRVTFRDIDADAVIAVRFFPRSMRDAAIAHAKFIVNNEAAA